MYTIDLVVQWASEQAAWVCAKLMFMFSAVCRLAHLEIALHNWEISYLHANLQTAQDIVRSIQLPIYVMELQSKPNSTA